MIGPGGRVLNLNLTSNVGIDTGDGSEYIGGIAGYNNDGYITNCKIDGDKTYTGSNCKYVGRLVGYDIHGLIINCHVEGSVSANTNSSCIGGLIGEAYGTVINNCSASDMLVRGYDFSNHIGGLVGKATETEITNCYYEGFRIDGHDESEYIGGLIGGAYDDCVINMSYSKSLLRSDEVDDDMQYVGGLVGWLDDSDIIESYSLMTINAPDSQYVGGLSGYSNGYDTSGAKIIRCYYDGTITGGDYVGGIAGRSFVDCPITDCYAKGIVVSQSSSADAGGIAGQIRTNSNIINCYSIATVTAPSAGGIIGDTSPYKSYVYDSYFLDISAPDNGYGTVLTDDQMKEQTNYSNWDFGTIWFAPFGNYPILQWQIVWVYVPDVIGSSQSVAESALIAAELAIGNITYQVSELIPEGTIINQSPSPSTTLPQGSHVDLIVSLGPPNPDITGEGAVDFLDFSGLASKWLSINCDDLNDWCDQADINHSGSVGLEDLSILAENWLVGVGH